MDKPVITGNTIAIPSDVEHLADVDLFIEGILRGWEVDESRIADIAISVSELVNNAICHGNKSTHDKKVSATIDRKGSLIVISVTDEGAGFSPENIENPIADDNLMKEVGRGIFIVKSLMDSVDFELTPTGSKVTIEKGV
ncbi:MAG: ATP-binding protein [candidate division Zixibacteria bacterium]|nr:ATP-binding protein [candidate division Zixibacteria bacterium]